MLKERSGFTQGSLRPMNGLEEMTRIRNADVTRDAKFSGIMAAQSGQLGDKQSFTPRLGMADTTGVAGNEAALTGRLRSSGGGFRMGHTTQTSIRKSIDESVFKKVLDGRLSRRIASMDKFSFGLG